MKCPKCGGEIPFYDLRPDCKHCGVNIMYYTQQTDLVRDAKRTELEGASVRMVVARVKAQFIGSKIVIARIILLFLCVAALLIPFGSLKFTLPLYEGGFSAGIIGVIQAFTSGIAMVLPDFFKSKLFSGTVIRAIAPTAAFLISAVINVLVFAALLIGFLNLTKSAKFMKNASLIGAVICVLGQIATAIVSLTAKGNGFASLTIGFGALAEAVLLMAMFLLNRKILKDGIEPTYRENDLKRKELLKKYRKGEIDLDDLPLPIFENEQEREERLKALEEALRAEEEGKEL